jgi:DNA transformation protein
MFGGQGLYKNGVIFGIIAEGDVYFKVDETNLPHYEKAGSHPFTYIGAKGRPIAMSYWKVPEKVLKNEKTLNTWIEWSLKASLKKSSRNGSGTPSRTKS